MKILIFIIIWAALSSGYGLLALLLVANLFGREGNGNHLAGFAMAFAIWMALTLIAVRSVRESAPLSGHKADKLGGLRRKRYKRGMAAQLDIDTP